MQALVVMPDHVHLFLKLSLFRVIEKDESGLYSLTKRGEKLLSVLNSIEGEGRVESNILLHYDIGTKSTR